MHNFCTSYTKLRPTVTYLGKEEDLVHCLNTVLLVRESDNSPYRWIAVHNFHNMEEVLLEMSHPFLEYFICDIVEEGGPANRTNRLFLE